MTKDDDLNQLEHATNFSIATKKAWVIIAISVIVCVGLYFVLPYEPNIKKGLCLLLFVAILWLSEAIHISITALLIPVLAILIGIGKVDKDGNFTALSIKSALSSFANPTIYLFFGGFALATALHIQKLDRKIAHKIISLSGSNLGYAAVALSVVTAGLSMWISNTATAAMMLPLALGLLSSVDREKDRNTFVFVLLAIAFSASIGGLGTMVGSPPNAIVSAALGLDFMGWMKIGLPVMIILFPLMLIILYFVFKPNLNVKIEINQTDEIPWTTKRKVTMIVFICTAFLWIFSKPLSQMTGIVISDAFVALAATSAIGILGLASWKEIGDGTDWGILVLFGGGLTLSAILKDSGTSLVLGNEVARIFGGSPTLALLFIVTLFILLLTEFTSNTASAALLVPVFASIATQVGLPEESLVVIIGLGASCAFMLPVATPPNAIVFGTGYIKQREMMKAGGILNIGCITIITLYTYFFLV